MPTAKISSDLHCQRAVATGSRTDFPVEGTPGLALRVTANGEKSWSFRYRRQSDGRQRRLTLGPYPEVGLKDARERARKALNAASDGADPQGDKVARREAETVAELAEAWLKFKERQGRRPNYINDSRQRIARFPKFFTEMKARDVRKNHVRAALDQVAKRGPYETLSQHRLYSAIFKWAVSESMGKVESDPTHLLKKQFTAEPRIRYFRDEEIRQFWHGVETMRGITEPVRIALHLCMVTGQRPSEIARLRQVDVVLGGAMPTLTVTSDHAKNHAEHMLPLPPLAVRLLARAFELAGKAKWVFPSPTTEGPIGGHALSRAIARGHNSKTKQLFGIDDAQLYDCRKTVATWLGNSGYSNEQIARLLNHVSAKNKSVTGTFYNHSQYLPEKKTLIDAWSAHLESVLRNDPPALVPELDRDNVASLDQARQKRAARHAR